MTEMIVTIPTGILIILILYLFFYRVTPLNAKQSGFIIGMLSLAFYAPVALIYWPGTDVLALNITVFFMTAYILGMFFNHREKVKESEGKDVPVKWFHWAPAIIVGFFTVVLIVDSVFVTLSKEGLPKGLQQLIVPDRMDSDKVSTLFPGVMHNNYHKKESRYNVYLRQIELIESRGWKVRKGWLISAPAAGEERIFQIIVEDAAGKIIKGFTMSGRFMRAADSSDDVDFKLNEVKPGIYQAKMILPAPGVWNLNIDMIYGDEQFELHASTQIKKAGE
ncbi:MAG: hypothetical protein GXP13_01485 [Gammaproteobacteria bacterium]|nr:hypothetical protein [Gammaproteobacteria bacterium]